MIVYNNTPMKIKTVYRFAVAVALGLIFARTSAMAQSAPSPKVAQDIEAAVNAADDSQKLVELGNTNPFAAMIIGFKLYDAAADDSERKLAVETMIVAVMRCKDSEEYAEGMQMFVTTVLQVDFEAFLEWLSAEYKKYNTAE